MIFFNNSSCLSTSMTKNVGKPVIDFFSQYIPTYNDVNLHKIVV